MKKESQDLVTEGTDGKMLRGHPSGKEDGMTNHPGLPRSEAFPRTGDFRAKTSKTQANWDN